MPSILKKQESSTMGFKTGVIHTKTSVVTDGMSYADDNKGIQMIGKSLGIKDVNPSFICPIKTANS